MMGCRTQHVRNARENLESTMKTSHWLMAGLAILALPVHAQSSESEDPDSPMYYSFRITHAEADFSNLDAAFNLGGALGFRFPDFEILGLELDFSSTVIPGENSGAVSQPVVGGGDGGGGGLGGVLDPIFGGGGDEGDEGDSGGGSTARGTRSNNELLLNTIAIYARAESPRSWSERFFASARVGYAYTDSTIPELTEDGRGHSTFGLGLGYRYGDDGQVELSYTRMSADLNYLSIGISY